MIKWPNFDGKPYSRDALAAHINAADFSTWKHKNGARGKPAFITLHNTSDPTMKLWLGWSAEKRQQYIFNAQQYYQSLGWLGGPHFFVTPQDDICAFGFNDLLSAGTHASCFNNVSIGIEMVGEFDREAFDSGPGAQVADNAIYLLALLHNKIGLTPAPYQYNVRGLHFHVECKADHHDCPGQFVHKPDVVARVTAKMAELSGQGVPKPGVMPGHMVEELAAPMPSTALPQATVDAISTLAAKSPIASYNWIKRGVAPTGYIKGMAVMFGVVYSKWKAGDPAATEMARACNLSDLNDALAWYQRQFADLHMSNVAAGADTLRHLFVLLMGVGMQESSGQYCCGRDRSADNTTADTAEAGLFQMSWNAHAASPLIQQLFNSYSTSLDGYLSIFQEGVRCGHLDFANYGDGQGAAFQQLCKVCPAFAVESAAVGIRALRPAWGTINNRHSELRTDADVLFQQVQAIVDGAVA
jgi:hypothetical protein